MEVSQNLNVSAKDFFDTLAISVAYDVSQSTGKKVSPDQLYSGYRYKKKMKNKVRQEGDVDVLIKQFTAPSCYEAKFKSSQGTNFVLYQIEAGEDGTIAVRYSEGFEGENASRSLNYKLVSWFYAKKAKKRMSQMLRSMEGYIKDKKEKERKMKEQ